MIKQISPSLILIFFQSSPSSPSFIIGNKKEFSNKLNENCMINANMVKKG
jgi:hypothetical protein